MKAWMLFAALVGSLAKASAGEYFYTMVPFDSQATTPVPEQVPEHFLEVTEPIPARSPKLVPAGYVNPVKPVSYCSELPAGPTHKVYGPPCEHRVPVCAPAQPRAAEIRTGPAEIRSAPAGVYSAPRPTGEVSGPSNAIGLRGLAVQFPAFRLELPTIQLPCLVRYRRNPEMRLDETVATYTTEEPLLYGQLMTKREIVQETPAVRHVEVEERVPSLRSAPADKCPPQADCESRTEMLRRLLSQAQDQCAATPHRQPNQLRSADSIEELNREYQARLQELIAERERQIRKANEELQMLRLQQGLPSKSQINGYDNAPPAAPAPRK